MFEVVPPELQRWAEQRGIPRPPVGASPSGLRAADSSAGPRVVLTSPAKAAIYQISPDLPLALQKVEVATAASGLGNQGRVELRVDGAVLASFDAPPYDSTWQLVPGPHHFQATAVDSTGNVAASDEADITVEQAGVRP